MENADGDICKYRQRYCNTDDDIAITDSDNASIDSDIANTDRDIASTDIDIANTDSAIANTDSEVTYIDSNISPQKGRRFLCCRGIFVLCFVFFFSSIGFGFFFAVIVNICGHLESV